MEILTDEIVNLFLTLIALILTSVIPAIYAVVWKWLKAKYATLPDEKRGTLANAALLAARFAEQLGMSDVPENIERLAEGKMKVALDFAITYLEEQGYDISDATEAALEGLIENVILGGLQSQEATLVEAQWLYKDEVTFTPEK